VAVGDWLTRRGVRPDEERWFFLPEGSWRAGFIGGERSATEGRSGCICGVPTEGCQVRGLWMLAVLPGGLQSLDELST